MGDQVVATILRQLGGSRFQTLTGARDFVGSQDGLTFRLPRCTRGIDRVSVKLSGDDTYTVTFLHTRTVEATVVAQAVGIYADRLRDTFTLHTGLACTL